MPITSLSPPQATFVESTAKESWLYGGLGCGKSTAGAIALRKRAWREYTALPAQTVRLLLLAPKDFLLDYMLGCLELPHRTSDWPGPTKVIALNERLAIAVGTYKHAERLLTAPRYNGAWLDALEHAPQPERVLEQTRLRLRDGSGFLLVTAGPGSARVDHLRHPDAAITCASTSSNPCLDSEYVAKLVQDWKEGCTSGEDTSR